MHAPNGRQQINSWAENVISGLVKDLIHEKSLDNSVKLVFTNSLYFKGSWVEGKQMNRTRGDIEEKMKVVV